MGKKMLTMSENGTLPDPQKMEEQSATWLYNCTWVGDFVYDGKKNTSAHIDYFFNHANVTSLDELPENWSNYTAISNFAQSNTIRFFPNPASNHLDFVFKNTTYPKSISIFAQDGKMVFEKVSNDSCSIDTTSFHPGIYIVKIEENNSVETYKIVKQ
jgi:mannan endo-1,4-beta-mannosidase